MPFSFPPLHKVLNVIFSWSVLLLVGLFPIFFIPVSWVSTAQSKMVLLIVLVTAGVSAYAWSAVKRGSVSIPISALSLSFFSLPLAYVISTILSGAVMTSVVGNGVEFDTLAVSMLWLGLSLIGYFAFASGSEAKFFRASMALLISSTVLLALQVIKLLFPTLISFGGVLSGETASALGSWQDLGILCGAVFIVATLLTHSAFFSDVRLKYASGVLAGVLFLFLIIVNIPDVWLLVALAFLCVSAYAVVTSSRPLVSLIKTLLNQKLTLTITFFALALMFFSASIRTVLPAPFNASQVEIRPSWGGTFSVGKESLDAPGELLFGTGPNTFVREWGQHKPLNINETPFWNTDFKTGVGSIPTSIVTLGALGFLAWLAIIFGVFWSAYRFLSRRQEDREAGTHGAVLLLVLYGVVFHVIYTPGVVISGLFFLALGILLALEVRRGFAVPKTFSLEGTGVLELVRYIAVLLLAVFIALSGISIVLAVASDMQVNRAIVSFSEKGNNEKARSQIDLAMKLSRSNDRAFRASVELGLIDLKAALQNSNLSEAERLQLQAELSEIIRDGLRAVEANSDDYQNWLALARVYGELAGGNIEGAYENAKGAYERAIRENPTNPLPYLRIAQLELLRGNKSAAAERLNQALQIKQSFAAAYYLRSQMHASEGNYVAAYEQALEAARFAQEDPLSWFNLGAIAFTDKRYEDARKALEQAVLLRSDYANALYLLSQTYAQIGRVEDARRVLEVLSRLNPNNAQIEQAIRDIENGVVATTTPVL